MTVGSRSPAEGLLLRRIAASDVRIAAPTQIDAETLRIAGEIITDVRSAGVAAVRRHAERFDGLAPEAPLVLDSADLARAAAQAAPETSALLERTAARIAAFAEAQRASLQDMQTRIGAVLAGQRIVPVDRAGCYAPGGRYPLPSSVLMTAVTARCAGVRDVTVATPRPTPLMLAAAHVAGAQRVLAAGGAQGIAALALGAGVPAVDLVVGPGNRFVTAAKQLLSGEVGIDLPAGPSELVVVADDSADPALVAADLLAQAEHDPDARTVLVAIDPRGDGRIALAVDRALAAALATLPTADVARAALAHGAAVCARSRDEALALVDRLAPEHLQLAITEPRAFEAAVRHCGAAFLGERAAEGSGRGEARDHREAHPRPQRPPLPDGRVGGGEGP